MKIAILGGGFTGLTAAFYLSNKRHEVTLFEKEKVLGGLAVGFKGKNWDWYLERAIHHWFSNDSDILNFAKEIGFNDIIFRSPVTASLYEDSANNYRIIPVDTPQDFLRFPYLRLDEKLRASFVLAFLKLVPFLPMFERYTARDFLTKTMGEGSWNVLWQNLFRKKFGKYAGKILASFIWARIKKRTKNLGYPKGGYQQFINHIVKKEREVGVDIRLETTVKDIQSSKEEFTIWYEEKGISQDKKFDIVISTLPTPIVTKVTEHLFPANYISKLKRIKYLHAISLILESENPLIEKSYWLNIATSKIKIMGLFQHTNFMDKENYNNKHILYISHYPDSSDPMLNMNETEILRHYDPELKKINSKFNVFRAKAYLFKAGFAQPIFDKNFIRNKPEFITPEKNFFMANLDMTYPYDRGTNYAVKLGKEVALYV